MAKKSSKKKNGLPLLSFAVDAPKELKGISVRSSLHELIAKYGLFVEQVTGEKADKSGIVDKGLQYAFDEDTAFQTFLKSGAPVKPEVSRSSPAAPAGQPSS